MRGFIGGSRLALVTRIIIHICNPPRGCVRREGVLAEGVLG